MPEPRPEEPTGRSEAFDAGVEEIRRLYGSSDAYLFGQLEDVIRRRLGLASRSWKNAALGGLMSVGIRLGLALLVTALFGQWTDVPWGRWAVILVFFGLFDGTLPWRFPPLDEPLTPRLRGYVEIMTPLIPTIARESDLQDLADFIRRWNRLSVSAAAGLLVTTLMLGAGWLFTPTAISELPVGSIVLLAFLLFDFGAGALGGLLEWAFAARQARYDHHLFWPSPADSPEVRAAMHALSLQGTAYWITGVLMLVLVLVSWDSPLVLPLSVGFIGLGYLVVIGSALGSRSSVRKTVERARHQQLDELRERIAPFESRYDLSRRESEQLRELLFLHDRIRDAPASPSATHTVLRAAAGLILPTIVFVITVLGEVTAERLIDAILP
jgi:hypothetical protein